MVLERCSVAWIEAGTAPAYTHSCSGATSTVLASRAVIGSNLSPGNVLLTAGSTNDLRVTLTLLTVAGDQDDAYAQRQVRGPGLQGAAAPTVRMKMVWISSVTSHPAATRSTRCVYAGIPYGANRGGEDGAEIGA